MKKKATGNPLKLNKETVVHLDAQLLVRIQGGTGLSNDLPPGDGVTTIPKVCYPG